MIGIILCMSAGFLVLRGFLSLNLWCSMSKGERKKYKKNCSVLNRWFLISGPEYVRDKYVKSEQKWVHYVRLARQDRFLVIVLHIVYVIAVAAAICLRNEPGGLIESILSGICIGYFLFMLGTFLFLGIREGVTYSKHHRSRYPRLK